MWIKTGGDEWTHVLRVLFISDGRAKLYYSDHSWRILDGAKSMGLRAILERDAILDATTKMAKEELR